MAEKQVDVMELEHKPEEFKQPNESEQKRISYVNDRVRSMDRGKS